MSNTNKLLKELTSSYRFDFDRICEDSRNKRLKELKPGDKIPGNGILYGDEAREQFSTKAEEYRTRANSLIDAEIGAVKDKITEAPSTDAVNSISLMAMRDKVTKDNINDLISRYGDNVQAFEAIKDIGKQKGIISESEFTDHPLKQKLEAMEDVKGVINRNLNIHQAERGHASVGFIALLDAEIDKAFEPEE